MVKYIKAFLVFPIKTTCVLIQKYASEYSKISGHDVLLCNSLIVLEDIISSRAAVNNDISCNINYATYRTLSVLKQALGVTLVMQIRGQ